jgi:hypothetical protein
MNRVGFLIILFYVTVASCGPREKDDIDLDEIKYDILRFDNGEGIFDDSCSYHYVTKGEIKKAERILRKGFETANKNRSTIELLNHREYGRQYIGAETSRGDVLIYAFCYKNPEDESLTWMTRIYVSDGGEDYFHVMINITTGEVIYFYSNGSA